MSKLARVLVTGALLTAMSLGSTAYAQDGDASSQQAGVTQSDPPQPQPRRARQMGVLPQSRRLLASSGED